MEVWSEVFISVDVETSGPIPGEYSMLSIGACLVDAPESSFERTLKPLNRNVDPDALAVTGFSLEELEQNGAEPRQAMTEFGAWVKAACSEREVPVFVGLNAPFDWSFVNYYFHRFHGENPFGFTALDIKAYYMGVMGCSWRDTRSSAMAGHLHPAQKGNHNAVQDAVYQAELFRLTREHAKRGGS
ncbi:3'-5' exonuclease [Burkholderia ubonensis]|uniref:3'-5' exonuclease n=1 Tax=Burkholderia ubonensis TaxID=101571 RepID=UPI00075512E6|nr:3'-5' exonuclease [Burkholderia ubonensis]KVS41456.1 DNA polymerase III subunit epsilon [Burkholderia ubonensis]KVS53842.1 DNA polymerase III subunit epsilon [Burkholderia ubonensis]KVS69993.1 DNA polymerase III subunit epsilon [Burkholderia ubonensis]KVS85035.1 DNA polymerase III subunit epsilon [Burkholderia ubonensis]KVS90637.1 DNA polymerase III subunit epsilon [Burkholderia ubonensis]